MFEAIGRYKKFSLNDISFGRIFFALIRRVTNIYHLFTWHLPFGYSKINKQKLRHFENMYSGKRCFIIANGPSLKKINFGLLKNEITIGMKKIFLMKNEIGFLPTYLVCTDKKTQLEQFTKEYNSLDIPVFYNWDLHNLFDRKENIHFIKGKFSPRFSKNPLYDLLGNGKSVAYDCMQLAFFMGFTEVYIIGKDHNYKTTQKAGETIKSDGGDNNHFIKSYYQKGMLWDAPDYKSEEYAYELAKKAFEHDGRIIKDATIGGKLNVFEKVDYYLLY